MSLTSYRAAPPRGEEGSDLIVGRVWTLSAGVSWFGSYKKHPFSGPGGDLLSRALRRSTIGPGGLNDRVRNGIGWGTPGIATRSAKRMLLVRLLGEPSIVVKKTSHVWSFVKLSHGFD